jgi:hypothetical protein
VRSLSLRRQGFDFGDCGFLIIEPRWVRGLQSCSCGDPQAQFLLFNQSSCRGSNACTRNSNMSTILIETTTCRS